MVERAATGDRDPGVAHQFDDAEQQREAATLGMWTFLVTEVLLFGGLFTGYTVYRLQYPRAFAEASRHLYMWIGTANTAVLLLSSFAMALAVRAAAERSRRATAALLGLTIALGATFLGLKGLEYGLDIREGLVPGAAFHAEGFSDPAHAQLFLVFYWAMTGLHAAHMTAGIGVLGVLLVLVLRGRLPATGSNTVEMAGLYWHFVDVVWLFLFPLLYLVRT